MKKNSKTTKAKRHETKGDSLMAKGKAEAALKEYKKATRELPTPEIYDKMHAAKDALTLKWDKEDFVESLTWTMQQQELIHPPIKQVHARLTPEWKTATDHAMQILLIDDDEKLGKVIEEMVEMGEIATRALIGILLNLKKSTGQK